MTTYYAGIGARDTPPHILSEMFRLAEMLSMAGMVLRSGGADGADIAFERGADQSLKQIFLPWKGFNHSISPLYEPSDQAYQLAEAYHPAWHTLKPAVRALMARNSHQLFGPNLDDPVKFVLCWTPGGRVTGGTGQALRMANANAIPVINFGNLTLSEIWDQLDLLVTA